MYDGFCLMGGGGGTVFILCCHMKFETSGRLNIQLQVAGDCGTEFNLL